MKKTGSKLKNSLVASILSSLHMQKYESKYGDTGVIAYEIGDDLIRVRFRDGRIYLYNYAITGKRKVEKMKILAAAGKGLTTFINQYVREKYASVSD